MRDKNKLLQNLDPGSNKVDKSFEQFQIKSLEKVVTDLQQSEKILENQFTQTKRTLMEKENKISELERLINSQLSEINKLTQAYTKEGKHVLEQSVV